MQEGEANARLQGFCRLHCVTCSLCPPVCWGCAAMWMGVAAGAARDVCWQLRFTELALALKAEGWAAVSSKLSSLRSHTPDPRVTWGSRLGVQQQCLWKGLRPVEPLPPCAPPKGRGGEGAVLRAAVLKGDRNISAPCTEGKGSPD